MNNINLKQLRWRCGHNGMLELDLIFTHFFDNCFQQLSPALQNDFVALLDLPDAELFAAIMGHIEVSETRFNDIIECIRQHNLDHKISSI